MDVTCLPWELESGVALRAGFHATTKHRELPFLWTQRLLFLTNKRWLQ
jgi:hypothetical protein